MATAAAPAQHADSLHISPAVAWAFFGAMVFGNFMAILDIQIVASSINEIQAGLGATQSEVTWVQTAYLIAEVIAIPLSGFMSRLLSTRVYFSLCAVGFALSSLLCGLAWNIESMLVFRAIQGFLGGGMIPTTMAALFVLFPGNKQAIPMVLVGMVSTLGPAIGPTLGGWLTSNLSWHWMFFINLAPGLLIAAQVYAGPDIDRAEPGLFDRIDWWGLLGMALFLGCLEFILDEGPRNDWFADHAIVLGALGCVLGAVVFFYRSLSSDDPLVDLRVFADRNFATSSIMTFVVGMVLYGMVYILPVFLGQVRGMNSSQIGEVMMVQGMAMFLFAPVVGAVLPRFDARKTIFIGMLLAAWGIFADSTLTRSTGYDELFWPQVMRGMGLMMCLVVMSQLAMATLPLARIKSASGVYNLTRNIGGAIGLAIINTILDQQQALHYTQLASQIVPDRLEVVDYLNEQTRQLAATYGDRAYGVALSNLYRDAKLDALVLSFNDLLKGLALLMVLVSLLVWTLKRPPANRDVGPAH